MLMNVDRMRSGLARFTEVFWEEAGARMNLVYLLPVSLMLLIYVIYGYRPLIIFSLILIDLVFVKLLSSYGISFLGIELGTLASILAGIWFGPVTGASIGFTVVMLRSAAGVVGFFISWKIPGFMLLGFSAGFLNIDLYTGGLYMLISLRFIFAITTFFVSKELLGKTIPYQITNIYIHFNLFQALTPYT